MMSTDNLRSASIRRLIRLTGHHPICRFIGSIVTSIVAIVLSLPFLLVFILVLPAYLSLRWILMSIPCNRRRWNEPEPQSVRGNDNRWLGTKWQSSVIHAVLVFEAKEGVNVDHFRRLLLKRVIPLYPRLKQRLIFLPLLAGLGNCWMTDAKFSIDQHVFSGPTMLKNEKDLQDYVSELVTHGLPEDKSPWQLQVFQSFGINQDTIVILRVHQSVADGTALMRLLCHSLADSQTLEIPERPKYMSLASCINVFRACMVGPLTLLFWIFFSEEDCNVLTQRSNWTGSVTVTWSASITLPKIIRIKQVTRSTVNCVLLSALAGALRRLIQGCGIQQPPDLKVVVPMDLQDQISRSSAQNELGNKTSCVILPLPVAIEGCVPRLWATRKSLDSLKTSADPIILYMVTVALMSIGSASFARHLINFFTDRASLQFSSFPGPKSDVLLEGQALKGIYPILPPQANLGISITSITYADNVFVSVLAERTLGPAAELILKYLEDQIEVLWNLLQNRRVPGEKKSPTLFLKSSIHTFTSLREEQATEPNLSSNEKSLNECNENEKGRKMSTIRIDFSQLVDGTDSRPKLREVDDVKLVKKPEPFRRAFFCTNCRKREPNLSRRLRNQSDNFKNFQREPIEPIFQNVLSLRKKDDTFFHSKIDATECPKDRVVNISEKNSDRRSPESNFYTGNRKRSSENIIRNDYYECTVNENVKMILTNPKFKKGKAIKSNKILETSENSENIELENLENLGNLENLDKSLNEKNNFVSQPETHVPNNAGPKQNAQVPHLRCQKVFQMVNEKQVHNQQYLVHSLKENGKDYSDESDIIAGGVLI